VVGVVKDYHDASVRHKIEPLVIVINQGFTPLLTLRVDTGELESAMAHIEATWARLYPDYPFEYSFLDDEFEEQYQEEANFAMLSEGLTILSILIACLGLFGLAAFSAEQRTKEIGVRKVLGASVSSIVLLLSKEFVRLVLIALVVAAPIAYLVMDRWLEDFAYRVGIGASTFILTGILALVIALGTVSYQALRAALADPVKALRYE
jgi:putative ABC transport system permease protein